MTADLLPYFALHGVPMSPSIADLHAALGGGPTIPIAAQGPRMADPATLGGPSNPLAGVAPTFGPPGVKTSGLASAIGNISAGIQAAQQQHPQQQGAPQGELHTIQTPNSLAAMAGYGGAGGLFGMGAR